MALALLGGFGLGGALALALVLFDASFRNSADFENMFQQDVIYSIPYLPLKSEVRRKLLWNVFGATLFIACGTILLGVIIYYWKQGNIII
jgi:hypothetical protein